MTGVEVGGITAVRLLERATERIRPLGDDNQVDVVGHQAVARQGESVETAMPAEKVQIHEAVYIGFENDTAAVAPLGHVMRSIESDNACKACHEIKQCGPGANYLGNIPSVPGLVHFDIDPVVDGLAVQHGGLELPTAYGLQRRFVDPQPQRARDFHVMNPAIGRHQRR